jgi:ankyrin repeat protein
MAHKNSYEPRAGWNLNGVIDIKRCLVQMVAWVALVGTLSMSGCIPAFADRWEPPSDIHAAVYRRDTTGLKKAIAANPDSVNTESFYSNHPIWHYGYVRPLSLAVERQWREGAVILLENGADAGIPMWRAMSRRDSESVRLFLEHGASPRQRSIFRDGTLNRSPLDEAVYSGDLSLFQLLVKYGAVPDEDLTVENKNRVRELHWMDK